MRLMETVTEKCEALSSLVAAVMVVVSGKIVRGYVSGGQLWFTCEGFCCFWLLLGPPWASVRAWHSHGKESSRQAESCWVRDLAGGLIWKQGMGMRALGIRGEGSKNRISSPRLPGIQAPLAASVKALPWLPATPPWGQEGLCPVPHPRFCFIHDSQFYVMTLRAGMETRDPCVL